MAKRILNFRPLFVSAVLFSAGIYFARDLISVNIALIVVLSLLFIGFLALAIKTKFVLRFVCLFLVFCAGFGMYFGGLSFYRGEIYNGQEVKVEGRVSEVTYASAGFQTVLFEIDSIDGKRVFKNAKIVISGENVLGQGDKAEIVGNISSLNPYTLKKFNSGNYKKNISYEIDTTSSKVSLESNKLRFDEKIRNKVSQIFNRYCSSEIAGVFYAVVFGDSSGIGNDDYETMNSVGISHILAVSGLHIGFLVVLAGAILSKLRLRKNKHWLVIMPLLLFYCYLCGFTASVVRASIICSCWLIANALGKEGDMLTFIGVAGFLILLVKPLYIFNVGFQLSFLCVLMIVCFSSKLKKFFEKKCKLGVFSTPLAISLCTQIGTAPIIFGLAKSVSVFSVLANLICLPIFQIAFSLCLIFTVFIAVMPFLSFLLYLPETLMRFILWIGGLLSDIPNSHLYLPFTKYFTLSYIVAIFCFSRLLSFGVKMRFVALGVVVALLTPLALYSNQRYKLEQNEIAVYQYYEDYCFALKDDEGKNTLVFVNFDGSGNFYFEHSFLTLLNIKRVETYFAINSQALSYKILQKTNYASEPAVMDDYELFCAGSSPDVLSIDIGEKKVLIVGGTTSNTEKVNIENHFASDSFDLFINMSRADINISSEKTYQKSDLSTLGNFTISLNDANLYLEETLD